MTQRLTADQLDLDPDRYAALLWVRDALDPKVPEVVLPEWMAFDMSNWGYAELSRRGGFCSSAFCIGGSMEVYMMGLVQARDRRSRLAAAERYEDHDDPGHLLIDPLNSLFFHFPKDPARRTPEHAVAAIDRVLAGETDDPWQVGGEHMT